MNRQLRDELTGLLLIAVGLVVLGLLVYLLTLTPGHAAHLLVV